MKSDLSPRRIGRKHQLADGVEDDLELGVVFVFQRGELAGKFRVREKHLAQTHKGAHDGMLTCTARELRRTLESIATPCSVKA